MPVVTVLMPTYNAMPYLPEAVHSICRQIVQDFTFLIIDDGSTDGTGEYLDQLIDPRVRFVRGSHRGLGAVLNHGIALCETEFLARMDADDVALPERLDRQLVFLREHPMVGMVGSQFRYIGANGREIPSPALPCGHDEIMRELLHGRHAVVHSTLTFRTSVVRAVGGYRIAGMGGEEWDLFLRMGEGSRVHNLGEVLYLYRTHPGNGGTARFLNLHIGIDWACHCAAARKVGRQEPTLEEFRDSRKTRPPVAQLLEVIDAYALAQYWRALVDLAERRWISGYARLLWSAACSPSRTLGRLKRLIFRERSMHHR